MGRGGEGWGGVGGVRLGKTDPCYQVVAHGRYVLSIWGSATLQCCKAKTAIVTNAQLTDGRRVLDDIGYGGHVVCACIDWPKQSGNCLFAICREFTLESPETSIPVSE